MVRRSMAVTEKADDYQVVNCGPDLQLMFLDKNVRKTLSFDQVQPYTLPPNTPVSVEAYVRNWHLKTKVPFIVREKVAGSPGTGVKAQYASRELDLKLNGDTAHLKDFVAHLRKTVSNNVTTVKKSEGRQLLSGKSIKAKTKAL